MPSGIITLDSVTLPATCDRVYLLDDADVPVDGTVVYEATLDGTTWETVTAGDITDLTHSGTTLGVRATLTLDSESEDEIVIRWFIAYAVETS